MGKIKGGYFKGPNDAFEIGLSTFQIAVYLFLVRCNNNSEAAFPSLKTIAEKCGMGQTKVKSVLKQLEEIGLISRRPRNDNGKKLSNIYEVSWSPRDHVDSRITTFSGSPRDYNKELIYQKQFYKKHYINFHEIDAHGFIKIYNDEFLSMMKKNHPKVTQQQAEYIIENLQKLDQCDVTEEEFLKAIREHFETLPQTNNGSILAFIHAFHRYFDVFRTDLEWPT